MFYVVSLSIWNKEKKKHSVHLFFFPPHRVSPRFTHPRVHWLRHTQFPLQALIPALLTQFKIHFLYSHALLFFLSVFSSSLPGISQDSGPPRKLAQSPQLVESRHHIATTGARGPSNETKEVPGHRKAGRLQLNSRREVLGQLPNQGSSNISRG